MATKKKNKNGSRTKSGMTGRKQVKKLELRLKFNPRRLLVWFLIIFLFLPSLLGFIGESSGLVDELALSEAIEEIKNQKVDKVEIRGDDLVLYYPEVDGVPNLKLARKEEGTSFVELLQGAGIDESDVKVEVASQTLSKAFWGMISLVAPILGFGLLLYFMSKRQMGGGGSGGMFGMGNMPEIFNLTVNTNSELVGQILGTKTKKKQSRLISQSLDLAKLSHGLLKGEELTNFIKRSYDIIK